MDPQDHYQGNMMTFFARNHAQITMTSKPAAGRAGPGVLLHLPVKFPYRLLALPFDGRDRADLYRRIRAGQAPSSARANQSPGSVGEGIQLTPVARQPKERGIRGNHRRGDSQE